MRLKQCGVRIVRLERPVVLRLPVTDHVGVVVEFGVLIVVADLLDNIHEVEVFDWDRTTWAEVILDVHYEQSGYLVLA